MKKLAMAFVVVSILVLSSMAVMADPICVPDENMTTSTVTVVE